MRLLRSLFSKAPPRIDSPGSCADADAAWWSAQRLIREHNDSATEAISEM